MSFKTPRERVPKTGMVGRLLRAARDGLSEKLRRATARHGLTEDSLRAIKALRARTIVDAAWLDALLHREFDGRYVGPRDVEGEPTQPNNPDNYVYSPRRRVPALTRPGHAGGYTKANGGKTAARR